MDLLIFAVGVFVFALLIGGLTFSVLEVRRLERAGAKGRSERFPL